MELMLLCYEYFWGAKNVGIRISYYCKNYFGIVTLNYAVFVHSEGRPVV